MKKTMSVLTGALVATAVSAGAASAADTLETVKARGELICGVSTGLPGFSIPDEKGNWTGIDVDVCRGVAAARPWRCDESEVHPIDCERTFYGVAVWRSISFLVTRLGHIHVIPLWA